MDCSDDGIFKKGTYGPVAQSSKSTGIKFDEVKKENVIPQLVIGMVKKEREGPAGLQRYTTALSGDKGKAVERLLLTGGNK